MYKFAEEPIPVMTCPQCNGTKPLLGRMFEDVDEERLPVLLFWHLGCGCVLAHSRWRPNPGRKSGGVAVLTPVTFTDRLAASAT